MEMGVRVPERWLSVGGFEGYEVSDEGRVRAWIRYDPTGVPMRRATPREVPLRARSEDGNVTAWLVRFVDGRREGASHRVRDLVLCAFVGPAPRGLWGVHLNGDRADCRLVNLAWGATQQRRPARRTPGAHVTNAKLTAETVRAIRAASAFISQDELARRHGVARATVCRVIRRRIWKDVD